MASRARSRSQVVQGSIKSSISVHFMRNMVGLTLCTQSTAMIFLLILTIWIALSVLVIGLCFAARLGDQTQHEPSSRLGREVRSQDSDLLRAPGVLLKAQRKFSASMTGSEPAKPPC